MTNASAPTATKKAARPVGKGQGSSRVVATHYEITKLADLYALLSERPAVFPKAVGDPVLPLAIGTLDAIKAIARPDVTEAQLRTALKVYTISLAYLLAQGRPNSHRHDLTGTPVEPVSAEHREGARGRFAAVRARRDRLREAHRRRTETAATDPEARQAEPSTGGAGHASPVL